MSLFKEKDDYLTKAFQAQFNHDSESDEEEPTESESNIDQECEVEQPPVAQIDETYPEKQETSNYECVDLDSDDDDNEKSSDKMIVIDHKSLEHDIITISSDDEGDLEPSTTDVFNSSLQSPSQAQNASQDLDDYKFNLKLTLAGSYRQFPTTYKTTLKIALDDLLKEVSSRGRNLIVTINEETISLEESPYSLKLMSGTILSAIEVIDPTITNPNEVTVKLQDGNRKHTKDYKIVKTEPLSKLMQLYAKEHNIDSIGSIKFCFDGDVVDVDSTAEDLDIEDDCVIDVMIF